VARLATVRPIDWNLKKEEQFHTRLPLLNIVDRKRITYWKSKASAWSVRRPEHGWLARDPCSDLATGLRGSIGDGRLKRRSTSFSEASRAWRRSFCSTATLPMPTTSNGCRSRYQVLLLRISPACLINRFGGWSAKRAREQSRYLRHSHGSRLCWGAQIRALHRFLRTTTQLRRQWDALLKGGIELPDPAREVVFPNGVPVQPAAETPKIGHSERVDEFPLEDEGEPMTIGEGDLRNETTEICEQSEGGKTPEAVENLLNS
jgi:hypothetical protein